MLCVLLALCMAFAICACGKPAADSSEKEPQENKESIMRNRLKHVTVTYDGETVECDISWQENACVFESYLDYPKAPIKEVHGAFDPESKVYSWMWTSDRGEINLPIFQYDDEGKITKVYNEDDPTEIWDVTYDADNVPSIDGRKWFEYDADKRCITTQVGGGSYEGVAYKTYEEIVIGANGQIEKVSRVKYVEDGNGVFQRESEETDYRKYTYDKNGNLVKYEEPDNGFTIIFEYYDDPIRHVWEQTIPIHYINFFEVFVTPFMWYLK